MQAPRGGGGAVSHRASPGQKKEREDMPSSKTLAWPNGKRVAVAVTVMYETWAEGKAPNYSVQTTHLKPGTVDLAGRAWSTYGAGVGVWRIIRTLDRLQ